MKYIYTLLIIAFSLQLSLSAQERILTIGDSTMANYDEDINSGENEQRGWAQMLSLFLKEDVVLDNEARNGRSTKSFYYERWADLHSTLKKGDYVIIQFGHNDEKNDGKDTDEIDTKQRGTAPWGQYQKYLRKYIQETRNKGATPILATAVVRRMFKDGVIEPKGRHSLSQHCNGNDSILNYSLAMKAVANELNVPLIDMTELTQQLVEEYGSEKSAEIMYVNTDKTHLKAMGGVLFSQLFVNDMISKNLLTDCFITPNEISVNPMSYQYGQQPIGSEVTKIISLLGYGAKEYKKLELSVNAPFQIAISENGEYKRALTLDNDKELFTQHIYIRFVPTSETSYSSNLTVKADNKILAQAHLEGEGIKLKGENTLLFSSSPMNEKATTENVNIKTISIDIQGLENTTTGITIEGGQWQAQEIDLDTHRYIGYTVTAGETDIYINTISFDMHSIGGNQMYFTAIASSDRWFKNQWTYAVMEQMQSDKAKHYNFDKLVKIPAGDTFYFRIYPWYKSEVEETGKSIHIENIEVRGIVTQ